MNRKPHWARSRIRIGGVWYWSERGWLELHAMVWRAAVQGWQVRLGRWLIRRSRPR